MIENLPPWVLGAVRKIATAAEARRLQHGYDDVGGQAWDAVILNAAKVALRRRIYTEGLPWEQDISPDDLANQYADDAVDAAVAELKELSLTVYTELLRDQYGYETQL